ncbi:hypothetical protein GCM10011361_15840 [Muriicola marianensis]|uniref:Uncharacterized protein n=1 Tax=Muriicola marianensis TaxID=1324801 RepID=A0ABQ1QYZ4_9FLAO|nr:hypothetical protein GCM10011361_15840 [Muriicola marianensis]
MDKKKRFRFGSVFLFDQSKAKPVDSLNIKAYIVMTHSAKQNQEKALKYFFRKIFLQFLNASM